MEQGGGLETAIGSKSKRNFISHLDSLDDSLLMGDFPELSLDDRCEFIWREVIVKRTFYHSRIAT